MNRSFAYYLGSVLLFGLWAAVARTSRAADPDPFSRYIYPLSKPLAAPKVDVDTTDAPETAPWAENARKLVREWFPLVTPLLDTDRFSPPKRIKLVFKKGISAPAYTSNAQITIKAEWVMAHPNDFGMVIHEMTHVIQAYPSDPKNPGWLVEGIADYIRWWRYEPESPRTPIDPDKATYHDSYRTTAAFLAWVVGRYDRTLVRRLDHSLRTHSYSDDLFHEVTGKTMDELWAEFAATVRRSGPGSQFPPRRPAGSTGSTLE